MDTLIRTYIQLEVVLLVTIWEILDRVEEGPACKETDFDLNIFSATVNRLVSEHNLKCTPEEPIPNDNTLADEVFEAGLELALEVGMLCTSTSRRVIFEEAEIKEMLKRLPGKVVMGEEKDTRIMKWRAISDSLPPLMQTGGLGQPTSEDIFLEEAVAFAQDPLTDYFNQGSLTTVYGRPIKAGAPLEVEAGKYEIALVREALRRVGRPGLSILGTETSVTCLAEIAASSTEGGLRRTDSHLVAIASDLKTDYQVLSKVVHLVGYDALICGLYTAIMGGYAGGPEGVAIARVAGSILGQLVHRHSFAITGTPYNMRYVDIVPEISQLRKMLWAHSIAMQALSRNSKLLIGGTAGGAAGPCTDMLFWEMVPVTMMHTVSGCAFIESCFAAFNKYQDRPGVLEARFTAELAHAISKAQITREKANDLVNNVLNEKLSIYDGKTAPEGKTFKECFDISKIKPSDEYYDRYKRIKMQAEDLLGISI